MKDLIFIYVISTFAVVQVTTSNATNVALHKPTNQSSLLENFGSYRAVDGNRSNVDDMNKNSCIHTSENSTIKQAWWRVDLESIYSITTVTITYRYWDLGDRTSAERLAGYSVYVSNTTNWWNGILCYHDNKTTLQDTQYTFYVLCHQSIFGQYVTIYNDRNSTTPPTGYSKGAFLELCEVEIQIPSPCSNCFKNPYPYCKNESNRFICLSGCEIGYYGEECQDNCTCGGNGSCYENGTCKTCDPRYYPSVSQCIPCNTSCGGDGDCDFSGRCLSCDSGKYKSGTVCVPCPSNCNSGNKECNSSDGTCIHGCISGFYGVKCIDKCMANCDICNNSNTCDKCAAGRHGAMCNLNCSNNCLDNICDRYTANCTQGCVNARYGLHCNKSCPSGCGGDTNSCTRLSGLCKLCINGKYGDECKSNCSTSCGGNRACGFNTGHCASCAGTMTGPFCEKEIQSQSGVPIGAMAGVTSAAVVVIVTLIIVIVWMKRGKSVKRDNIYSSATTDSNKADDHVYLSVGYTSENGINTHSSTAINPSEGHNDSNTKTPSDVYEDIKELARGRIPSDKTKYYNL